MPAERSLLPYEVTKIISWGKRWRAMKTLKQMARKYGVSESTILRIINSKGYAQPKKRPSVDDLARGIDSFSSVPRGTNQGDECTTAPS